ncbi:hypothetical protein C3E79_00665 [Corynebacterium liangguodongii]|uniref:Uncharacterized protein n=2 Tax=Corynebacterium liangguodongii TaxID=2079535 RepID=A0A2S0WBN5_9CORY|nr:hypothetical protein C3E79_00665 [Corynebacterium liangguodongii]PWB98770.1 hypothetical protein DF219_10125 [Corynebacterium liangguodongii]
MPAGGAIVLGVDPEQDFAVVGLPAPAQAQLEISQLVQDAIAPAPELTFDFVDVDSHIVLIIDVAGRRGDEFSTYEGVAYLRRGGANAELTPDDVALLQPGQGRRGDFEPVLGVGTAQLSGGAVEKVVDKARAAKKHFAAIDDDAALLELLGVVSKDGEVRVAGLYALGAYPQSIFEALGVILRIEGVGDEVVTGALPELLERAERAVADHAPQLPAETVRTVLADALLHRDLTASLDAGRQVEVEITGRAVTVTSPGRMPANERLRRIAALLETSDGRPVFGFAPLAQLATRRAFFEHGLREPRTIDAAVATTVVFPLTPRLSEAESQWLTSISGLLTPLQGDILVRLRGGEELTPEALAAGEYPWYDGEKVSEAIAGLEHSGLLYRYNGIYKLKGQAAEQPESARSGTRRRRRRRRRKNNREVVVGALEKLGTATVSELESETKLSKTQIRYVLNTLIEASSATMEGGRGQRRTTYTLVEGDKPLDRGVSAVDEVVGAVDEGRGVGE